jgi:hypothetical protein
LALVLMQAFPHGWPFVHFLQQVCYACSIHSDARGRSPLSAQGM